jgi:hypothetical protein
MEFLGVFIKFGEQYHMEELLNSGSIYCNPVSHFVSFDDENVRRDEYEDVNYQLSLKNSIIAMEDPQFPEKGFVDIGTAEVVKLRSRQSLSGNLFCLSHYHFSEEMFDKDYEIDSRCNEFGSHAVIIVNVKEFIIRLQKTLDDLNYSYSLGAVTYVDFLNFTGHKHLYQKDIKYSWQKEYRLHIENLNHIPIKVELGDLSDIASIISMRDEPPITLRIEPIV